MFEHTREEVKINTVELRNFRNYSDVVFVVDPSLTIFVGQNAVGKTNVIEALQLLTAGESFRKPAWSDVVMWGKKEASISLHARREDGKRELDIEMRIKSGQRSYFINGKKRKKVADVKGFIPSVLFTPEDLQLIKDSAEKRRSALDAFGGQMAPAYDAIKSDYEKVLKHRNTLLKKGSISPELLDPWTEKLVEVGTAFYTHRKKLFSRVIPYIQKLYKTLSSGEELTAFYIPSWDLLRENGSEEDSNKGKDPVFAFSQALERERNQEYARGTTLVGPQRDEIIFMINGKNARLFGSQGQQRSVVLAWKLAEIEVIQEVLGISPILLLDDVMSELDAARREALTRFVGNRVQTFITTTNTQYFDKNLLSLAEVIEVEARTRRGDGGGGEDEK